MPDIEKIKREGVLVDLGRLAARGYSGVSPDDHYRLKTAGVCGQRQSGPGAGQFMLRVKIPYGQVRPAQLNCLAALAENYGRGWGHLTTRQGLELHSVQLEDVPAIFEQLAEVGLTTKAACGDTIRNVVTCAHTGQTPEALSPGKRRQAAGNGPLFDARPWALLIQNYFLDLGPENLNLPRKMNLYITGCPDCIGHARINDLGLVATTRRRIDGTVEAGFALWVGGGLGANPRLGHPLRPFLSFEETLPALEAVVKLYIEHGSRKSRAAAKLKFLIEEWGMGRFGQEFEKYFQQTLPRFNSIPLPKRALPMLNLKTSPAPKLLPDEVSLFIPNGEIPAGALRQLAEICTLFGEGYVYFTKEQNICFKNLLPGEAGVLRQALATAGFLVEGAARIDDVLACPGTAFCPIAATPSLSTADRLHHYLREQILERKLPSELQQLRIHISGCPNSCAQHQIADIGLSGTRVYSISRGQSGFGYQLFLGGSLEGTGRLGLLVHHGIPQEILPEVLLVVLNYYWREREEEESFSQYIFRLGQEVWEERLEEILNTILDEAEEVMAG